MARLAVLLALSQPPTRVSLLKDCVRFGVVVAASPELQVDNRCYINGTQFIRTKGYQDYCSYGRLLFSPPSIAHLTKPFYIVQLTLSSDELC